MYYLIWEINLLNLIGVLNSQFKVRKKMILIRDWYFYKIRLMDSWKEKLIIVMESKNIVR